MCIHSEYLCMHSIMDAHYFVVRVVVSVSACVSPQCVCLSSVWVSAVRVLMVLSIHFFVE